MSEISSSRADGTLAVHMPDPQWIAQVCLGFLGAALAILFVLEPSTAGIVLALVVFGAAFLESQAILLLVLVFLLPFNVSLPSGWVIRDAGTGVRFLLVVGFLVGRMARGEFCWRDMLASKVSRSALLFLGAVVVSVVFGTGGDIHEQIRGTFYLATYVGIFFVTSLWVTSPARARKVIGILFVSSFPVFVFSFIQKILGDRTALWSLAYSGAVPYDYTGRPPSFLGHPTALGTYLVLVLSVAVTTFIASECAVLKKSAFWVVLLGTASLLLSESRGAIVAFGAVLLVSALVLGRGVRRKFYLILSSAGLAGCAYLTFQLWGNPDRFASLSSDWSFLSRIVLWGMALKMFVASPLHGFGIGTFTALQSEYLPNFLTTTTSLEVHNFYFELLAETGILGFAAFLLLLVRSVRAGVRSVQFQQPMRRTIAGGALVATVGVAVFSISDHNIFWAEQVGCLYWLILGLMVASETWTVPETAQPSVCEIRGPALPGRRDSPVQATVKAGSFKTEK